MTMKAAHLFRRHCTGGLLICQLHLELAQVLLQGGVHLALRGYELLLVLDLDRHTAYEVCAPCQHRGANRRLGIAGASQ